MKHVKQTPNYLSIETPEFGTSVFRSFVFASCIAALAAGSQFPAFGNTQFAISNQHSAKSQGQPLMGTPLRGMSPETGTVPDFAIRHSSFPSPHSALPSGWFRSDLLHGPRPELPRVFTDSDLIVGAYPDTNETLTITGSYGHSGRIIIGNNGTLILDHADFTLQGDIFIFNSGRMHIQGGHFTVVQHFAYQYGGFALHNGELVFDSAQVNDNGQSWGFNLVDSARLTVRNSVLRNGFTTLGPGGRSHVVYDHCDFPSEYVVLDSSRVELSHCTTALVWFNFPDSSIVDITLPGSDTVIRHWVFSDSLPGVAGIRYRVSFDSVSSVMWGAFPRRGCQTTIRNSTMRSTGVILQGSDSIHISGLVNNQHYADYTLPVPDRTYRLVNSDLQTWNLYPYENVRLVLESSIFGEMLSYGAAKVTVNNSICDGSGGYIGADSASQFTVISSTINTQFISRGRALLFAGLTNINFWPANATSGSIMLLMFCPTEYEPLARDTAAIWITDFRLPSDAQAGALVPVPGTAEILSGPFSTMRLGSYQMFYASNDSQTNWHPVGPIHVQPVNQDTLDVWDTYGLAPGAYILKMRIKDTLGDSIEPTRGVYLNPNTAIAEPLVPDPRPLTPILSISPNPSCGPVHIILQSVICNLQSTIEIHDASGRLIRTLPVTSSLNPSIPSSLSWDLTDALGHRVPPGIYFVRVQTPAAVLTAKVILTGSED